VSITYAPLISSEGHLLNIIADIRDITRFRQADELKSTFISIISHELKTPVALIKGYVSTLRREDARWDKKVVRESLKVIEEEADRLTGLIENLLDASRLQAGGLTIKKSDCNLPEMVRRVAEKFRVHDPEHPTIVDFPQDFPVILADENRLEQVVSNLISNSIKYAPKGDIHISGQIQTDSVIVCVKDDGPGIAPEDVPYVFDRFFRATSAAKNTKGAGLGLYLARSIIEAHGGRIWVDTDSLTAKGTRICFTLPIQSLENPAQPA
jgi:signal transduction histidine kinase